MKYRIDVNSYNPKPGLSSEGILQDHTYEGVSIFVSKNYTYKPFIGCKKALNVPGPSRIVMDYTPEVNNKVVWMESDAECSCSDGDVTYKDYRYVIHIDRKQIMKNQYLYSNKIDKEAPYCTVFHNGQSEYCGTVNINGPSIVVRDVDNPLPNGGTVWIGTNSDIEYVSVNIDNIS